MTFEIPCPNCGPREVQEFSFGGESTQRPPPEADGHDLARYLYFRENVSGPGLEWWYHRDGCEGWFLAVRDTRTNVISETRRPGPGSEAAT